MTHVKEKPADFAGRQFPDFRSLHKNATLPASTGLPAMHARLFCTLTLLGLLTTTAFAGDTFLHWQTRCSRCSIPGWDYQTQSNSRTPSAMLVSESAVEAAETRSFTFDKLVAGPLRMSSISAFSDSKQSAPMFTATLEHTGGDTGLLAGGQAQIRVEGLVATAGSRDRGVVVCTAEKTVWVRRGTPLTINLELNSETRIQGSPAPIERVRVYMQYRASR